MSDLNYERRSPPSDPALVASARQQPNGWVYEIDWPYPDDQRTPPEAIRGGWQVAPDGQLTDIYSPNPRYRAIERCDRRLKPFMLAGAHRYPGQWIVEIDPRGEHLFPDIPENMIRGWWYVDAAGSITDRFRPNSRWIDDGREAT